MTSLAQVRDLVLGATLDDEFYAQMQQPAARTLLRSVLIEAYFAPELHGVLLAQGETNAEAFRYSQALLQMTRSTRVLKEHVEEEVYVAGPVRSQGFRRVVVVAYEHRCAFCGIRMQTTDGRRWWMPPTSSRGASATATIHAMGSPVPALPLGVRCGVIGRIRAVYPLDCITTQRCAEFAGIFGAAHGAKHLCCPTTMRSVSRSRDAQVAPERAQLGER